MQFWRLLRLAGFLALVVGRGSGNGLINVPADWYAGLDKPVFNPPNWIFAPVWLTLYVFIAIAGWRIWERAPRSAAMTAWWVQLGLNWLWSPVFFTLHWLWPAFAIIVAIWLGIVIFIVQARAIDRISAWLFVPYLAWVSFASVLNLSIAWLN